MKNILIIFFNFLYFLCLPQVGEYIAKIDHTTGSFIKTGPAINGVTWIYADDAAYIESAGTFIFPSSTNPGLFSINATNGAIVSAAVPPVPIWYFSYNNTTGKLYGLQQDNTNNQKIFVNLNPATGTFTQIGTSIPGSALFQGSFATFDQTNDVYIFMDPTNVLYSINASNGAVISSPTLILASGQQLFSLCFDNSTGKLYALLHDSGLSLFFLATINRVTGAVNSIGAGTTFGGSGSSAIDEANQGFIYMYGGGASITTLDMTNGAVVHNVTTPLTTGSNLFSLKYDRPQKKLYSIHWEAADVVTGINQYADKDLSAFIYPNPGSGRFNIEINDDSDVNIDVMNTIGQLVFSQEKVQGKTSFDISELPDGIYYVRTRNGHKFETFKLVKNSN